MNWELLFRWVGGASFLGLLTLLLRHYVVSAPVKFAAATKSDTTLITDLQTRVLKLETSVARMQRSLTRTTRERDALAFYIDWTCGELRVAAAMHETGEKAGPVLIERWKNARDSDAVLEGLSREDPDETRSSDAPPANGSPPDAPERGAEPRA